MAYFPQYFQDKAVQGRQRNGIYLLCQWRMRYIQLHGYILGPFSDIEAMRHHYLFSGYTQRQRLSSGRWVGQGSWVRVHVHDLYTFSVDYLWGQCYKKDREAQRLDQSLFSDSQAYSEREKGSRKHLWVEQRTRGSKTRRKHPKTISTWKGLSDHCVSFNSECNCTKHSLEFLWSKTQILACYLSVISFNL